MKKGLSRKFQGIIVLFICVFIVISYWYFSSEEDNPYWAYDAIFTIRGEGNYSVIIPIPIFDEDTDYQYNHFFEELEIKSYGTEELISNSVSVNIVTTEYGNGLKISANQSISISYRSYEKTQITELSMGTEWNNNITKYWIYGYVSNDAIVNISSIGLCYGNNEGSTCTSTNDCVVLQEGWHQYYAETTYKIKITQ